MAYPKVDIAPTVFFAYTDITAAASRALLGVEGQLVYQSLSLPTLEGASPACVLPPNHPHPPTARMPPAPPLDPVQVINMRYEAKRKPQFTFLVINTHIPNERSHRVAKEIVDLCAQRHVMKLIMLTTQRLDIEQRTKLFENTFNGMAPVTQRAKLPQDIMITDAFLSSFIQLCMIEGQPYTLLTAPAHRCPSGQANMDDGSLQLVRLFQNTLSDWSGLMFSDKLSASFVFRDSSDEAHAKLMYA